MKTKIQNLKTFLLILLPLYSLLLGIGCKKEKEEPQLPAETQTGANTFGCYVNGELFVNDGTRSPLTTKSYAAEYVRQKNLLIIFSASKLGLISISVDEPQEKKNSIISSASFLSDTKLTGCNTYLGEQTGEIVLTKFDTINCIVSGKFQFAGQCELYYNPKPLDILVSITSGRFDIKLDIYDNDN